jgi:hypothetical protein
MTTKEIDSLIKFHEYGLSQYGEFMSPSAQYLEKQTITALKELRVFCFSRYCAEANQIVEPGRGE